MAKSKFKKYIATPGLRIILGLLVALLAIFTIHSVLSYAFTWKLDQSYVDDPALFGDGTCLAGNAGSLGLLWGRFLVYSCFGVASLVVCWFFCSMAIKLLFKKEINWVKMLSVFLLGCIVGCLAFALISNAGSSFGWDCAFGSGLGGLAGSFMASSLCSLFGIPVTVAILVAMAVVLVMVVAMPDEAGQEDESEPEPEVTRSGVHVEWGLQRASEFPAVHTIPPVPSDDELPDVTDVDVHKPDSVEVSVEGPEEDLTTEIKEELRGPLNIREEVNRYNFPPSLELLRDYADKRFTIPDEEIRRNIEKIKATLASFKIGVDSIKASVGYTVTLYRINLADGVKVSSVKTLEEDIAIKLGTRGVRVVILADSVGIEVPNEKPSVVPLKAILNSDSFRHCRGELPIAIGYTTSTVAKVFDLADAPHLLVAGATKQGKSVGLNAIIASLLYSKHPAELKFVFIDPKMVEFHQYGKLINHYLAMVRPDDDVDTESPDYNEGDSAIVKDPKNAEIVLRALCQEMDKRYKLLSEAGVNKVTDYNEKYRNRFLRPDKGHYYMPYLVVVIDEYADLTKSTFGTDRNLSRSIENSINRLAAKGRAAGLHVIIATQRPSVDVITGTIKGNFPTRMAFRTAQRQDSQTILGIPGAEKLLGKGDMLFFTGAEAERVQCALVDTDEIDALTKFVSSQTGFRQCCPSPYYLEDPGAMDGDGGDGSEGLIDMQHLDSRFEEAARITVMSGQMSTTLLQRKMQLGFARAGKIMDQMEAAGIIGPQQGAKPRACLVPDMATLQPILDAYIKS